MRKGIMLGIFSKMSILRPYASTISISLDLSLVLAGNNSSCQTT